MFKRIVTIITLIATSTLFFNETARARLFASAPDSNPVKERKRACLPCGAAQGSSEGDPIDNVASLGRRTQILPFMALQRSLLDGTMVNLVSTATGHLSFAVTDLVSDGPLPLLFQRAYNSDHTQDTGLGAGWSFAFDDRITLSNDTAALSTGTGSNLFFRRDGRSQHFVLKTDAAGTHQSFDLASDNSIVEQASGITRSYKKQGASYRLSQIADTNGNAIKISFNSQGNISRITGGGSREFTLEWSEGRGARLLAVTDNIGRRVIFKEDGQHLLRSVTDAAGAQWTYDYQGGRLARASDPSNRLLLRARYDRAGRVIEAGDAAGANRYEYDSATNDISRRTVVTDPLGAKTIFEQTERGAVSAISNDEGEALLEVDYDEMSRPVRIANRLAGDTVFNYDEQNRLVNQASSDGTFQTYTYDERGQVSSTTTNEGHTSYIRDERGNITQARTTDPAQSYQTVRNARGQTVSVRSDAGGEVSFEYDASGNMSAFSTNKSGRFEIETDAAGRVTSRRLPSGALYRYEYDPRGLVVKQSDNRGRAVIFERDAGGAVMGVVAANGSWMRASRDQAGRIVSLSTSAGKSRRFAYDARGALIDYADARGKRKHFGYDRRGRLESVDGDDGNHTVIERDEKGRFKRAWSFNLPKDQNNPLDARPIALLGRPGAAQLLKAGYNADLTSLLTPQGVDCFFGSDGFQNNTDFGLELGFGCSDPFGAWDGFGGGGGVDTFGGVGGGGFGSFDPFFGSGIGSCQECIARRVTLCALQARSCLLRVMQTAFGTSIGCIGIALLTGVGLLICAALLVNAGAAGAAACRTDLQACLLELPDKCSLACE